MSKNTARISRHLGSSNALWISLTRNNNWLVVESPGRLTFGYEVVPIEIVVKVIENNFSNILPQIGSRDIGL